MFSDETRVHIYMSISGRQDTVIYVLPSRELYRSIGIVVQVKERVKNWKER